MRSEWETTLTRSRDVSVLGYDGYISGNKPVQDDEPTYKNELLGEVLILHHRTRYVRPDPKASPFIPVERTQKAGGDVLKARKLAKRGGLPPGMRRVRTIVDENTNASQVNAAKNKAARDNASEAPVKKRPRRSRTTNKPRVAGAATSQSLAREIGALRELITRECASFRAIMKEQTNALKTMVSLLEDREGVTSQNF